MSTRRGGKLRCGGGAPEVIYTLHRMDADGKNVRTLSFHETNEWNPSVMNDGRILYTRWDYVDRSASHFHGLWTCNADGTNPAILFGNYTTKPNACYQGRAVPGSNKVVFIAGMHHAQVGGSLVMLDPSKVSLDPRSGNDRLDSLERLTPEVGFPETDEGRTINHFHSPWPLSENYFLVSYSFDPIGFKTGLYYFDRFDNLELLYRQKDIAAAHPVPFARGRRRRSPRARCSRT